MAFKWRFILKGEGFKARYPEAEIIDTATGKTVGEATSYTYGGIAWAVHTREFGGNVPFDSKCITYANVDEKTPGLEITLTADWETDPVRGNLCASDEPELDRAEEDEIIRRIDAGDVWAWCFVCVTATYRGVSASDTLGACSYADEKDFRDNGSYADMVSEVLIQLNAQLEAIDACELAPHKAPILACACGYTRRNGNGR